MPRKCIVFLDIDGPMIPMTQFLFHKNPSFEQILDKRCVDILKLIIDKAKAQIVFNTTHNTMLEANSRYNTPGLRNRFREAGFEAHDFPPVDHTGYPYQNSSRLGAIQDWLRENGEDNLLWVAFDDAKIEHHRAYQTSCDDGIGFGEYQHAAKYLMFKPKVVL